MKVVVAVLASFAVQAPVLASTDCPSTVTSILVETGPGARAGYVVTLDSGLSFAMAPDSLNYREILGMATGAQMIGYSFAARFAADGVNCKQAGRRTDLIAIIQGPESTPTTTTTPQR